MTQKLRREKMKEKITTFAKLEVRLVQPPREIKRSKPCFCHIQPRAISKDSEGPITLTRVINASVNYFKKYF
jgi:hypothetical protein